MSCVKFLQLNYVRTLSDLVKSCLYNVGVLCPDCGMFISEDVLEDHRIQCSSQPLPQPVPLPG